MARKAEKSKKKKIFQLILKKFEPDKLNSFINYSVLTASCIFEKIPSFFQKEIFKKKIIFFF